MALPYSSLAVTHDTFTTKALPSSNINNNKLKSSRTCLIGFISCEWCLIACFDWTDGRTDTHTHTHTQYSSRHHVSSAQAYLDLRQVFYSPQAVGTSSVSCALANTTRIFCCTCSACTIVHTSLN